MPTAIEDRPVESRLQSAGQLLRGVRSSVTHSDLVVLIAFALAVVLLHTAVNGQYGFHRDELLTYTNAMHLDWGYDVYPPITAVLARIDLELFGTSLRAFRFAAAVAHGLMVLLTGLAARELGGKREAQLLAAFGAAIIGGALVHGSFLSYSSFDFPCWILVAYCVIRLLKTDNPRWCIAIGAAIAVGMTTKYSIAFFAVGLFGGLLLTPARRYFMTWCLWCGVAVALLIMLPNMLWQVQHHFATLDYLKSIHARDIRWGWTNYFLVNQLWKNANPVTLPVWLAGLWFVLRTKEGKRYRMLGWMYVIPLLAFLAARGRDYYLSPAYPMLLAAGAVYGEQWINTLSARSTSAVRGTMWWSIAIASLSTIAVTLPIAPLGSAWWRFANQVNGGNFDMQIGWQEYVQEIAKVRDSVKAQGERSIGILAYDEGEAGAVNLYGPAYNLPNVISGMNSNWYRGYGDRAPEVLIVVGMDRTSVEENFDSCRVVGRLANRNGIANSSVARWNEIFVCSQPRRPWPEFWAHFHYYG